MTIGSPADLAGLIEAGQVVARTLERLHLAAEPGVTTGDLDAVAAEVFSEAGARSAPYITYGFPGTVCISLNDEAVHGIPGKRKIRAADLLKLDVTAELNGYVADAAVTIPMPEATETSRNLAHCAAAALADAVRVVRPGMRVNEIGRVVEERVERQGFKVLRRLTGHGVGRTIHEPPNVPNYFQPSLTDELHEGMVLTIEPIISVGTRSVTNSSDGWTVKTADRSFSAHFEHTLAVQAHGARILTAA